MFRRKKARVLSDWPSLQDALTGSFDAHDLGSRMEFWVEWKSERRKQRLTVAYAPVPNLGPVAFITAPIEDSAESLSAPSLSAESAIAAMEEASAFLSGGICIDGDQLALRATIPFEGMPFEEFAHVVRQIAASADECAHATPA